MKVERNIGHANSSIVNLRCPICRHNGAFHGLLGVADASWTQDEPEGRIPYQGGIRKCPNPDCEAPVFVFFKRGELLQSFPPETIDFDSTNLPPGLLATLEEAIRCQAAECHKAAALMVRRVLEEMCEDKSATGKDLKARLSSLEKTIVLPKELLAAADELRLLGNDAAHVEAKDYDAIGKEEAALAIELAKELLKAVYQYTSLVEKLKALKKS